jgi:hypothetical protein
VSSPPARSCLPPNTVPRALAAGRLQDPFTQYATLGAEVVWGSPANPQDFPAGAFDVVYDNNGKDLESCQPLIDRYGPTCKQVELTHTRRRRRGGRVQRLDLVGLAREVETPLPSNSPHGRMILRVDLTGSHGRL